MHFSRCLAAGVLCLCLVASSQGDSPPQAARLVHDGADLLLEVPAPRRLADTLLHLDLLQQLQVFPDFREFLDSTRLRRGLQLVRYLEKELGAPWPELLDRLAGGGAAFAVKFGSQPAPVLLVVQGTDDKLMAKFFQVGLDILDQEIARQEGKDRLVRDSYHGLPTAHAGKQFHAAVAGSVLLVSNSEKALHAGLDRHLGRETKSLADSPLVQESRQLLPKEPLARIWVNLNAAHKSQAGKALYKAPRDDANLTVLVGGYLDLVGRSPYVCAGVYRQDDGFLTTIRVPRGLDGMGNDRYLHLPPAGEPGSRPLLEPKGVLLSQSNYLNFSSIWNDRTKLFPEKQVKSLEEFDKRSARFLLLKRMSELLKQVGPYYRLVAVNQTSVPYKTQPEQIIPAFALISELREPEAFGKSMEAILRAAVLLINANPNIKLKLAEQKYKDCTIVCYRFDESKPVKGDPTHFRFNFSPCFTRVGNQFVYCSTLELCRELVDLLHKEAKEKPASAELHTRTRIYGAGGAELLRLFEDQLVTQTILDQAVTPAEAREQGRTLIDLVRRLGTLDLSAQVGASQARYDIRLTVGR